MGNEAARSRAEALMTAWNQRDYAAVADNVSPDLVCIDHIRGRQAHGASGYVDRFKPTLDAFEDMQGETLSLITEGNHVAHESVWRGRHTAPLKVGTETIPPTGERVTLHLATHMEVDGDGKPTTIHTYGTAPGIPSVAHATGSG